MRVSRRGILGAVGTSALLAQGTPAHAQVAGPGAEVLRAGQPEYALIEYLARRAGQVVTRAEIWEHLYDFASDPSSNVVDVYVGYLRRKIDRGHAVQLLGTHRGLGYSLGRGE